MIHADIAISICNMCDDVRMCVLIRNRHPDIASAVLCADCLSKLKQEIAKRMGAIFEASALCVYCGVAYREATNTDLCSHDFGK